MEEKNINVKSDFMKVVVFDKRKIDTVLNTTVEDLIKSIDSKNDSKKRAFISAANSLGFMDGGSDLGYMNSIPRIQQHVQTGFRELGMYTGLGRPYLPIGCSMGFQVPEKPWFFVSCPTMFWPENVSETQNPFHSLCAGIAACKHLEIDEVYCPMLCTGFGGFETSKSLEQMNKAIASDDFVSKYTIKRVKDYIFAIPEIDIIKHITNSQPKTHPNTEFYVDIGFDLGIKAPW